MVEVTVAFDTWVVGRSIKGETAPAADAENTDTLRIDILAGGQVIDRRAEIVGADFRRGQIAGRTAALAVERRVERDGQKTALGERLGVAARHLFLDGPVRSAYGDGR